jgi:putative oxidoreductase
MCFLPKLSALSKACPTDRVLDKVVEDSGVRACQENQMSLFSQPSANQLNVGLAILRIVVGIIFLAHGAQKLFVFGFAGVTGAFGQMGLPMPDVLGPLVALMEFFGGLGLILGLLTRIAAVGPALVMLGAILVVHRRAGLFLPNGYEYALTLLAALTFLILAGAGSYSVDAMIRRRSGGLSAVAGRA